MKIIGKGKENYLKYIGYIFSELQCRQQQTKRILSSPLQISHRISLTNEYWLKFHLCFALFNFLTRRTHLMLNIEVPPFCFFGLKIVKRVYYNINQKNNFWINNKIFSKLIWNNFLAQIIKYFLSPWFTIFRKTFV